MFTSHRLTRPTHYSWGKLLSTPPTWLETPIAYDQIIDMEPLENGFYEDYPDGGSIAKGIHTNPPGDSIITMTFLQELIYQDPSVRIHLNYLSSHDPSTSQDNLYLEDNAVIVRFTTRPPELNCSSMILDLNKYHSGNRNETRIEFSVQPFGATYESRFGDHPVPHLRSPYSPNQWDSIAMTVLQPDYDGSTHVSRFLIRRESDAPLLSLYRIALE